MFSPLEYKSHLIRQANSMFLFHRDPSYRFGRCAYKQQKFQTYSQHQYYAKAAFNKKGEKAPEVVFISPRPGSSFLQVSISQERVCSWRNLSMAPKATKQRLLRVFLDPRWIGVRLLLLLVLLVTDTSGSNSSTIVTTLPGYSGELPFSLETG